MPNHAADSQSIIDLFNTLMDLSDETTDAERNEAADALNGLLDEIPEHIGLPLSCGITDAALAIMAQARVSENGNEAIIACCRIVGRVALVCYELGRIETERACAVASSVERAITEEPLT